MAETQDATTVKSFAEAERRVMEAYGLAYENHFLELAEPQISARVIEVGEGEPVLMVHGAFDVAAKWTPLMAELTGYQIFAVDLPGYGLTDPFVYERGELRNVAVAFLDSVIDALGFDSLPVVANSMGGLWTFWLALDRPDRVKSIAQIGCPALILDTSAPLPMRLLSVRGLNRLLIRMLPTSDGPDELRQMGDEEAAEVAQPEYLALLEACDGLDPYWLATLSLLETAIRLRGSRTQLTEEELAHVEQPTLFVWGTNDPFGSPDVGSRAASVMPDARLVPINGGHIPWVSQPETVADPIRQHFERVDEARST